MMKGFSAIGLIRPKYSQNLGGVLRAAYCFGAAMVALEQCRASVTSATDTPKTPQTIPVLKVDDLKAVIPFNCTPIAVDLVDDAVELSNFTHPKQAFYVFGPEDGTIDESVLSWCQHRVMIPTRQCLNLAATVNVVLYDRQSKQKQSLISEGII